MKRLLTIMATVLCVAIAGCSTTGGGSSPSHPSRTSFETNPSAWIGHESWGWLWIENIDQYLAAIVLAGGNCVGVPALWCSETASGAEPPYGPWADRFDDPFFQGKLKTIMDGARARKLTAVVQLFSWEDANDSAHDDAWMLHRLQWFIDRGPEGVAIVAFNEMGHDGSNMSKLLHWEGLFAGRWPGAKGTNRDGGNPRSCYPGWFGEVHPQKDGNWGVVTDPDFPKVIVNDARINVDLTRDGGYANVPTSTDYYRRAHKAGRGVIILQTTHRGDFDAVGAASIAEALK